MSPVLALYLTLVSSNYPCFEHTVELQWLEHCWLVYHDCFELVLESLGKNPIAADVESVRVIFFFNVEKGILCVLIRIA